MSIAIDGPAGAGKSTVAQLAAKKLGYTYIDTGAMYRALTLAALERGVPIDQEDPMAALLQSLSIELQQHPDGQKVFLGDWDVTEEIRHPDVTRHVSAASAHPKVRELMAAMQRTLAKNRNVVMDGRDIGTNVLPDAEVKIFLTASIDERAFRRYRELVDKGLNPDLQELRKEIAQRDEMDSNRETAPLRCAEDALVLDTTGMDIPEVVNRIVEIASNKNRI